MRIEVLPAGDKGYATVVEFKAECNMFISDQEFVILTHVGGELC